MARRLGPLLPVLLVGLLVLQQHAQRRDAERIRFGEQRAVYVLDALAAGAAERATPGAPHPGLAPLLPRVDGLQPLAGAEPGVDLARDRSYVYALARLAERDAATGAVRHDWVLRAWPLEFGRTGDTEFQIGSDGVLWEGQNLRGRSGLERGFPPPFPEPDPAGRPMHWWPRPPTPHR